MPRRSPRHRKHPRARVQHVARSFFDFASADLARHQLMNQRTIPGFEPSPEAFAPSQRAVQATIEALAALGVTDRGDVEILFAILSGLVDQQLANDPGGTSRRALLERAVDMWADGVGLPAAPRGPPYERKPPMITTATPATLPRRSALPRDAAMRLAATEYARFSTAIAELRASGLGALDRLPGLEGPAARRARRRHGPDGGLAARAAPPGARRRSAPSGRDADGRLADRPCRSTATPRSGRKAWSG